MTQRLLPALLALLVIAATAWLLWPNRQPLPPLTFNLTDGRTLASADLLGKPVLVNFWSVSCEVCLRDMPKLERLATSLAERGLTTIGVAMPYDPPTAVIELSRRLQPGFPIALDVHGELARAFGDVDVTPSTFLVGRDGTIVYAERGPIDETRIRATFLTL